MSAEQDMCELIEASAGTGKTQALGEKLIAWLRQGVKPQEIVALTFSRAAAGEIFERFVTLLAKNAANNADDARLLRSVIDTQHLSLIGTLDSFLMRMVRGFPLELGLLGDITMLDEYQAAVARATTSFSILRRTDATLKRTFVDAFSLALNNEDVRKFSDAYDDFVHDWHEYVLSHPDADSWGNPTRIWPDGMPFPFAGAEDLARAADALAALGGDKWNEFAEQVRGFRGAFKSFGRGYAKCLIGVDIFSSPTVEFKFGKKTYSFGGEQARAIQNALKAVYGYVLRMKCDTAHGVQSLVSAYEQAYDKQIRRKGKLVFSDIPRLVCGLGEGERLAMEYRLDAHIRAWALDEFQDTSHEQWDAISPLIEEAKQSNGEKGVFVVGDCKQAIYGWRNGDVGIFRRESESRAYRLRSISKTYRSGPAIVEAVNRVFVDGMLSSDFPSWHSPKHETAHPDRVGFVQTMDAKSDKQEGFVEPIYNALRAVDPVRRGLSAAILVRGNDFGEFLAGELKRMGMKDVVWEGESDILDTPALQGFLDLVSLADHPGDEQSYSHFATTPLAAACYPDGLPPIAELSAMMAREFTKNGLVRSFRAIRRKLPENPSEAWSDFTEIRFTDFLRAAAEFELIRRPETRLSDFARFVKSQKKRNLADPGRIRIMTIHRSKGLSFDYVILPLYEHNGIEKDSKKPLVGENWVLPHIDKQCSAVTPVLREAAESRIEWDTQETLCIYYVAMTRAKYAMTIVTHPQPKSGGDTIRFSNYVRDALNEPIGTPDWYEHVSVEKPDASAGDAGETAVSRAPRVKILRRLPSLTFHSGQSAGTLFDPADRRSAALARGEEVHAKYEKVEWLDEGAANTPLEKELVRPADAIALWRERAFEIFADGRWISGRFDRVVFAGSGDCRRAIVYDYKTNAQKRGEDNAAFEHRMAETYAGQMSAYRSAVCSLAGLACDRVSCRLLLTATQGVVELFATEGGNDR